MEHENCLLTRPVPIINPHSAIFNRNWWSVTNLMYGLFNWLTLVPDWFRPVLHSSYCSIIARKNDISIWHLPIDSNTN